MEFSPGTAEVVTSASSRIDLTAALTGSGRMPAAVPGGDVQPGLRGLRSWEAPLPCRGRVLGRSCGDPWECGRGEHSVLTSGFFCVFINRKRRNWGQLVLVGISAALVTFQLLSVILFILL